MLNLGVFKNLYQSIIRVVFVSKSQFSKKLKPIKSINRGFFSNRVNPIIMWKYIGKDFIFSFFVTLVFFIIIFIVNQLLLLTKDVLQIDIPFIEVLKLLFFKLPDILALSIPFATLVSCLMSVGHFSTYNEFVAMKANGVSFANIFFPYLILSFGIMIFALVANEVLIPWGTINSSKQYRRVLSLNPQLGLAQNSIKRYQNDIIITKGVEGDEIQGIVIVDTDSAGDKRVILADSAKLANDDTKNGVISIELSNINSLSTGKKPREYNYFIGESMRYNILLKDLTTDIQKLTPDQQSMRDLYVYIRKEFRTLVQPENIKRADVLARTASNISEEYLNISKEMQYKASNPDSANYQEPSSTNLLSYYKRFQEQRSDVFFNRNYRISEIILYRKLAFPFAIILFVIIAFPMGQFYKRSGRTVGFGMGLILSFAYWFLIIMNQSIGINSLSISAFFIMWYPNFLMMVVGLFLFLLRKS